MHHAPLVIKIGGVALEQQRAAPSLWSAIIALHASQPGGVVLVHGGGKAVDALLTKLQLPTLRSEGIRITPPDQMDIITGVLAGTLNKTLVGVLNAGAAPAPLPPRPAVGLCLGDGGALRTSKSERYSFDAGRVGECDLSSSAALLATLLGARYLPVLSSIGIDDAGGLLNINADDAAGALARVLRARGLVLMTDVPGVKDAEGRIVPELSARAIEVMIASAAISGGMIPKVRAALETARAINAPVTIMSGSDPQSLVAWASGTSTGTRVVPS